MKSFLSYVGNSNLRSGLLGVDSDVVEDPLASSGVAFELFTINPILRLAFRDLDLVSEKDRVRETFGVEGACFCSCSN